MKKVVLFFLLVMVVFYSCDNLKTKETGDIQKDTIAVKQEKKVEIKQTVENLDKPMRGSFYPIKFIKEKIYSKEEFPEDLKKEKFIAFIKGTNFQIKPAKLIFTSVFDAKNDSDSTQKSSTEVVLKEKKETDTVLFIVKDDKILKRNPKVDVCKIDKKVLIPGDKVEFKFNGIQYYLHATGEQNKDEKIKFPYINYKLYLSKVVDGIKISTTLVEKSYFDDSLPQLLFAGDLDGDKSLDLLINTSTDKSQENPTLYLSKDAIETMIVNVAGMKQEN
ncbi:MAG: hypothetical protein H6604_03215 [Flavobacteriales bacterium]|nr:hypothetical protein [Flavobacteriales bacterium]